MTAVLVARPATMQNAFLSPQNHHQYSLHLPTEGWLAEWTRVGWINTGILDPP